MHLPAAHGGRLPGQRHAGGVGRRHRQHVVAEPGGCGDRGHRVPPKWVSAIGGHRFRILSAALGAILRVRWYYRIATSRQVGIPEVSRRGMLVLVHQLEIPDCTNSPC